ncbi:PIR Superfamily Protein [Plasmodium ovale curtisi]|uniref:PIR Superfamily Protein n=1 Tax=Plasmodium ovale curtisi TaxID=864141 RepID=A0A1A8VW70_PLAOA|nr:PIR Superfamily Protein [Plasmodium ovale curtisi]SBT02315.1 PIR Superfamily Protein [Plasmodium ovale curtisi]
MSENIILEAHKLLKEDGLSQKNLDLHNIYDECSRVIKDEYAKYEKCIKENEKQKPPNPNVTCKIGDEIESSLGKLSEQFKSASIKDSTRCDYLLCWMSGKIDVCKNSTYCIIRLLNIFSKFWENCDCCEKKDGEEKECKKTFVIEFDKEAIKNKKELYEFLDHYDIIENILNEEITEKKEIYCKYSKYIFELYSFLENEDNKRVHKKYEKELKHFQNAFKSSDKLSKLKKACNYPNLSTKSQIDKNNENLSLQDNFVRYIPFTGNFSNYIIPSPSVMDDILGNTPSYKLYKEFDSAEISTNEYDCSKKYFKESTTYQSDAITVCKKIIKNFDKLYENKITAKADNRCLHYKNWAYFQIWKFINSKSEYTNAVKIINKFLDIQKENNIRKQSNKDVCHYYFIFKDFIELNAKREEKDLHDYFLNHSIIEKNISPVENDKEKYKEYLRYIKKLYERHKKDWNCCSESGVDPLCVHYFKCEEEYNPSDLLEILNGANKETVKMKYKNIPLVRIGEKKKEEGSDGENVMRIQFGRCSRIYDPNDKKKVVSLRCDYRASRDHFDNFYKKLPDEKKDTSLSISGNDSSTVNINESSVIQNASENESNPIHYKIPMSVALGLGTVFVFFLYYKFTPFGSLFGKRNLGRDSFEDGFNEEYMREFSYDSEYEDVNLNKRRIQIAYQRA